MSYYSSSKTRALLGRAAVTQVLTAYYAPGLLVPAYCYSSSKPGQAATAGSTGRGSASHQLTSAQLLRRKREKKKEKKRRRRKKRKKKKKKKGKKRKKKKEIKEE